MASRILLLLLSEAIECITADWPARVASAFAQYLKQEQMDLLLSTDDISKAYRRFASAHPRYSVVVLRNPDTLEVRYFTMPGFNFGQIVRQIHVSCLPC